MEVPRQVAPPTEPSELGQGFPRGGVFRASLDAVIVMDAEGTVRDWNPAAEALFGFDCGDAIGREVAELIIPPALRDAHRAGIRRFLETSERRMLDRRLELTAVRRDGSEFEVELSIALMPDAESVTFVGFIRSLDVRSKSERASIRMQKRMAFLAQAGLVLDRSPEYADTLRALAELTVPDLAQLTVIDLLDERGGYHMSVAAAERPQVARDVEALRESRKLDLGGDHPVAAVLRSGSPVLLAEMSASFLEHISQGETHFELMQRIGYHSAIVVPLVARGRTLGTLSLLRMHGAPTYTDDDLTLAQELARRAALSVDNARLFESIKSLAHTLQQSLLPPAMPKIEAVRVTGHYRPADLEHELGGDFYDAFELDYGRWAAVIGDVCGKGPEAAALTALARYTVRALAGHNPGAVMRRLNETVLREADMLQGRFLTAVYMVGEASEARLTLRLTVAGHPLPLVLRNDGEVEQIPSAGPLVGLDPDACYGSAEVVLAPGEKLVLYTDGLTDAQAPQQILSEADLADFLRDAGELDAGELARYLEQRGTGGGTARDDLALLVIEYVPSPARVLMPAAAPARQDVEL